jgi:hypothetical protein
MELQNKKELIFAYISTAVCLCVAYYHSKNSGYFPKQGYSVSLCGEVTCSLWGTKELVIYYLERTSVFKGFMTFCFKSRETDVAKYLPGQTKYAQSWLRFQESANRSAEPSGINWLMTNAVEEVINSETQRRIFCFNIFLIFSRGDTKSKAAYEYGLWKSLPSYSPSNPSVLPPSHSSFSSSHIYSGWDILPPLTSLPNVLHNLAEPYSSGSICTSPSS